MRKLNALLLALVLTFSLAACGGANSSGKTAVYTFSGGNEYFNVVNGVVVLGEDEEVFNGGDLKINRNAVFKDVSYLSTKFYILIDGEERTVLSSHIQNQADNSGIDISGDLGAISGGSVITDATGGKQSEEIELDLLNNLYFKLTISRTDGTSNTYTVQMDVESI